MGFLMGMMGGGNDSGPAPVAAAPTAPTPTAAAVQPEQTIQPIADTQNTKTGKKKAVLGLSSSTLGSTSSSAQTIGKTSLLGG